MQGLKANWCSKTESIGAERNSNTDVKNDSKGGTNMYNIQNRWCCTNQWSMLNKNKTPLLIVISVCSIYVTLQIKHFTTSSKLIWNIRCLTKYAQQQLPTLNWIRLSCEFLLKLF